MKKLLFAALLLATIGVGGAPDAFGQAELCTPNGNNTIYTCPSIEHANITISGSASAENGVDKVFWAVDTDGDGNCTGTTSWTYTWLPLTMGANVITITGRDGLGETFPVTVNVTRRNPYIVTSYGANGSISPDGGNVTVTYGGNQLFNIAADAGYHVSGVLVNGLNIGNETSYTFTNVIYDQTLSATFAINTYTITASANAGGTIAPTGITTVNHGGSQSYEITPEIGYALLELLVDGESVGFPLTYTFTNVTANHTIAATFALNQITPTEQVRAFGVGMKGSRFH